MTRFDTDTPWDIKTYPKHSSFFTIWLVYSSMYTSMWMCSLNVFLFRKNKDVALFSACIPKHMRSFAASLSRMPSSSMGSNGWCHDVMPHFPPFPPNSPGLVKAAKQKKGVKERWLGVMKPIIVPLGFHDDYYWLCWWFFPWGVYDW